MTQKKAEPPGRALIATAALFATILIAMAPAVATGGFHWYRHFGPQTAIAALLLITALGLGGLAATKLNPRTQNKTERQILNAALGMGMISATLALAGLVDLLRTGTALAIASAGLLAFALQVKKAITAGWTFPLAKRQAGLLTPTALTLLSAALAMAALAAMAPPVSYDVLEYHLAVPSQWIAAQGLVEQPYNFYSQLPYGVEMLYSFGLLLDKTSDAAPKLINFILLTLTCATVAALSRRMGATKGLALLGAAHFAAHGTTLRIYLDAFADMGAALFATTAVLSIFAWGKEEKWNRLILTGLLAGFALSAKTATAGIFLLPALIFLIPTHPKIHKAPPGKKRWTKTAIAATLFLAAAAAAFSPWPLRNYLISGNPGAPFLNAWFGNDPWRLETERFWLGMHGWATPLSAEHLRAMAHRAATIGWPWVLGTLAALAATTGLTRRTALTTITGYAAYCLLGGAPDRFAIPLIALAIALTHGAVGALTAEKTIQRQALTILLILVALPPLWKATQNMLGCRNIEYAALSPEMNRQDYEENLLGATARLFQKANEKTPKDANILLLYEARSHLLQRKNQSNTVFDKSPLLEAQRQRQPGQSLAARLRAEGYTHLLINEYELARLIATHATPETRANRLYQDIQTIENQWQRFEALAQHPEWHTPYARMQATSKELKCIANLIKAAEADPIAQEPTGKLRLLIAKIPDTE